MIKMLDLLEITSDRQTFIICNPKGTNQNMRRVFKGSELRISEYIDRNIIYIQPLSKYQIELTFE